MHNYTKYQKLESLAEDTRRAIRWALGDHPHLPTFGLFDFKFTGLDMARKRFTFELALGHKVQGDEAYTMEDSRVLGKHLEEALNSLNQTIGVKAISIADEEAKEALLDTQEELLYLLRKIKDIIDEDGHLSWDEFYQEYGEDKEQ